MVARFPSRTQKSESLGTGVGLKRKMASSVYQNLENGGAMKPAGNGSNCQFDAVEMAPATAGDGDIDVPDGLKP